jgi:cysteine desulfurase family protein
VTQKRIYFDNAASSFPKPEAVINAMSEFLRTCGNPGRGAHAFALEGARQIFDAREKIARFLGVKQSERLVFTPGCTASINMVLKGFALQGSLKQGDVVIVSSLEHNSMMRPLAQLEESIGISHVVCHAGPNFVSDLAALVERHSPKLVALTWASNVTGELLPIPSVAKFLQTKNIPLLVDGAQTAGKIDAKLDDSGISFFCASGHKGLMGAPGVGLLYVASGASLAPIIAGGTGSRSESLEMPTAFPDRLEAGTLPGPAIAALAAGVHWIETEGVATGLKLELALTDRFLEWAKSRNDIQLYGPVQSIVNDQPMRVPVVSFSMNGIAPSELADLLDTKYGIAVRSGLHCASVCHEQLGTLAEGTVRASFGVFNTGDEVQMLCDSLEEIAAAHS